MDKQKCQRCNAEEYIPTHQYVKFDSTRRDVCTSCWNVINKWLYDSALKEPKPNPGRLYPGGTVTGREPRGELVTGREPGKRIPLRLETFNVFLRWFNASNNSSLEKRTE